MAAPVQVDVPFGHAVPGQPPSLGCGLPLPEAAAAPVHELVAELASLHPDRCAVRSGGQALTYAELDAWAARIAARLHAAGVGRGERVGLVAEPSAAAVASALGILRAGAAYVPVDLAQPDLRLAEILADARVAAVVTTRTARDRLSGLGAPLVQAEQGGETAVAPAVSVTTEDPAYLIYTSGSTGEPKGVLVEHGQLAASTLARRLVYPRAQTFLLVSSLAFDSSVAGLWGTLTTGGTLVVAAADEVRDPGRLVELVREHRVTQLLCVPTLYAALLDAADRSGDASLRTLDTVITAGEPLPQPLLDRHFAGHGRSVALVNEYGPTETTVWASYQRYYAPAPVCIGGPVPGVRLYVLDEQLRPVPPGAEGELVIGGAGVTRGYFGRPAATAACFVDDPFAGAGARMYRSGDLVRWNDRGTLDFLGRRDHQVKIRGHRVEAGAVEAALCAVAGVRDAVVVPDAARTRLAGFVIARGGVTVEAIRAHVAGRLPAAWVPARIELVDSFPLNVNGKVDRARLCALLDEPLALRTVVEHQPVGAVDGGVTAQVAAAWMEVLKLPAIPPDANFFDLGGHSLTVFQLQDALERHTGARPSVVTLFRHTTLAAQAALIGSGGSAQAESPHDMRQAAAQRARAVRTRQLRARQEAAS